MGFHFGPCGKRAVKRPIKFSLGFLYIFLPSKKNNKNLLSFFPCNILFMYFDPDAPTCATD